MNAIYNPKTRNKIEIYNEVTESYEEQIHCTQWITTRITLHET